jgi:hypothetical protein
MLVLSLRQIICFGVEDNAHDAIYNLLVMCSPEYTIVLFSSAAPKNNNNFR